MSDASDDRRKHSRRKKWVRNLFSYLNRRDLFRRGRRKDEGKCGEEPDWFDEERKRSG